MQFFQDNMIVFIAILLAAGATICVRFVIPYLKNKKIITDDNLDSATYGILLMQILLNTMKLEDKHKYQVQAAIDSCSKTIDYIKKTNLAVSEDEKRFLITSAVNDVLKSIGTSTDGDVELQKLINIVISSALKL